MAKKDETILFQQMSRLLKGSTPKRNKETIEAFGQALADYLRLYGECRIVGFGAFKVRDTPNTGCVREVYNFSTGEKEEKYVEESVTVYFTGSEYLKCLIQQKPHRKPSKKLNKKLEKSVASKQNGKSDEQIRAERLLKLRKLNQ